MKFALFLAAYAAASAFGLYKMKAAPELLTLDFFSGFLLYGLGFLVWLAILRVYPLSTAFPVAAGSLIVATQIIGAMLLREHMTWPGMLGVALIGVGIVLVSANRGVA